MLLRQAILLNVYFDLASNYKCITLILPLVFMSKVTLGLMFIFEASRLSSWLLLLGVAMGRTTPLGESDDNGASSAEVVQTASF